VSLLSIDIGTTECKAIAFIESGHELKISYEEYPSYFPNEDQCELDLQEILEALKHAIYTTAAKEVKDTHPVRAIGISTLGDSVTPVDSKGNPFGRT